MDTEEYKVNYQIIQIKYLNKIQNIKIIIINKIATLQLNHLLKDLSQIRPKSIKIHLKLTKAFQVMKIYIQIKKYLEIYKSMNLDNFKQKSIELMKNLHKLTKIQ